MIGPNYSDEATWRTVVLRKARGLSDVPPPGQIDKPVITPEIVETSCAISLSASANSTYTAEDHALFLREQEAKKQIAQLQAAAQYYYRQYRQ